jgi:hypothetical protein
VLSGENVAYSFDIEDTIGSIMRICCCIAFSP